MFRLLFALAVPSLIGYCFVSIILKDKKDSSALERFALAFIIGTGILTIEMLFFSLLQVPLSITGLMIPLVIVLIPLAAIIIKRKSCFVDLAGWKELFKEIFSGRKDNQSLILFFAEKALIAAISIKIFYVLFETLIKSVVGFDAFAYWSMKAKIIFAEKGIAATQETLKYYKSFHGSYPAHIPLLETWMAICLGSWHDVLIKIFFPVFFLCTIFIIYSSLRRSKKRTASLFFAFLFSSLPFATYHAAIAYADLPIAVYYTASILFLYRFIKERGTPFLIISAIALGMAGWTKNEGLAIVFLNFIILISFLTFVKNLDLKEKAKQFFVYAGTILLFVLPWEIFKKSYKFPVSHDQMPQISKLLENFERLPVIIIKFYEKMFFSGNWQLLWLLVLLTIIFYFRKVFSPPRIYLLSALILNLLLLGFIYYSTRSYGFLLDGTTLNRNLLLFSPLAVFFIGDTFD